VTGQRTPYPNGPEAFFRQHSFESSGEKAEMARLRRENTRLRQEREILEKAAAWFAQEANTAPPKSSDS